MANPQNTLTKPPNLLGRTLSLVSGSAARKLSTGRQLLPKIAELEEHYKTLGDQAVRKESLSLRYRAKSGEPLAKLLPEAFALARQAAWRTVQMRHFDVQILGGVAMANGSIAEMETGEGKTLTATLPLYLHALIGKGAHLATVNDYLAQRDAQWMEPVYRMLGMTVGVIQSQDTQPARRKAYACDITYGTAKEFGFDFLRDRLLLRSIQNQQAGVFFQSEPGTKNDEPVGRGTHFVLVDEADCILIDEARTPLIIGTLDEEARQKVTTSFQWAAASANLFEEDRDYEYDHKKKTVELTLAGRMRVRSTSHPEIMNTVGLIDLYEYIERAIKVERDFIYERQYVVNDGEIVIVDEFTGRLAEGRKWRDGIHQAIEAKEKIEVSMPTGQAARITVQDLFSRYKHLAGMTGTAASSARELRKVYKLTVVTVPTNRPSARKILPDRVFANSQAKWEAIVEEVCRLHEQGRPLLIGTKSIDRSELLSQLLTAANIEHQVLNAHHVAAEADIVARAGQRSKVTVATNMAGRGTDIKLGTDIGELGGLHVICTELHDSARIDRQLIGRCGRQGDPGTVTQYLAWDDDILLGGFGPKKSERLKTAGSSLPDGDLRAGKLFRRAQSRVEREHSRQRMVLLHAEKERKKMQVEIGQDPYLDTPD